MEVFEQCGECAIEFTHAFNMKIKILMVCVVIGMSNLHKRRAALKQTSGKQAMPTKIVAAIAPREAIRLISHIKERLFSHHLSSLIVRLGVSFGFRGVAGSQESRIRLASHGMP